MCFCFCSQKLLLELLGPSRAAAEKEKAELAAFAKKSGFEGDLQVHDVGFWAERLREETFGFTEVQYTQHAALLQAIQLRI